MDDRLLELVLAEPVLLGSLEVTHELFGAAGGDEAGDRNEAPVALRQLRTFPNVAEDDVVGQCSELGVRCHDSCQQFHAHAAGSSRSLASNLCHPSCQRTDSLPLKLSVDG